MKMSHRDMRQVVTAAFNQQFGREPNTSEAQCAQAICGLETGYASTWHPPGAGSNNEGAIQKGGWTGKVFTYTDTHPNADGTSTPYSISFRWYDTPFDGVLDVVKVVYCAFDRGKRVLPAATRGDLLAFSTELHRYPCYYEGMGATDAERIAHHHNAVLAQIQAQCADLGEPMPETQPLPVIAPALFLGCKGPAVGVWQKIVGAKVDDDFGGATQTATRAWQAAHGLPPSGVVCQAELDAAGLGRDADEEPTNPTGPQS